MTILGSKKEKSDIMRLLNLIQEDGHSLFERAREIAKSKESVFATGVQINTNCTMNPLCRHCIWRWREKSVTDFRRKVPQSEVINRAMEAEKVGIERVYIASGWMGFNLPSYFYDYVRSVKEHTDLEVFGLFGPINQQSLAQLKEVGMDGYRCGIESPNEHIFAKVRPGDNIDARLQTLRNAKQIGLKTWSGFIIGLGENEEDIARGIEILKKLDVDSVLLLPFNPVPYTEMEKEDRPNPYWMAKVMAVTRIYLKNIDLLAAYNNVEWGFISGCNGALSNIHSSELEQLKKIQERIYANGVGRGG